MNKSNWIISKKFDLTIFLIPLGLATLSLFTLLMGYGNNMPLWAFLAFIVTFDVAHVWATIYRTYLDKEEFNRRKVLYLLPIPIFLFMTFRLHYYSAGLFWTILAYVAIFHFIRQNYGFMSFYKVKNNETSSFDYYLDKITIWAGALGPVLWWHATPKRQFDWFNAGESFILKINPHFIPDITALYFLVLGMYILRQAYLLIAKKYFNQGKNLIIFGNYITWAVGIFFTDNPIVSASFLNLFHGIPFITVVWYYTNKKWNPDTSVHSTDSVTTPISNRISNEFSDKNKPSAKQDVEPFIKKLSKRKNWYIFYLLIFIIALVEEIFWDGIVWKKYIAGVTPNYEQSSLKDLFSVNRFSLSIWVAILSLPQIMHYFLDAWIWKFNKPNKEMADVLNLK